MLNRFGQFGIFTKEGRLSMFGWINIIYKTLKTKWNLVQIWFQKYKPEFKIYGIIMIIFSPVPFLCRTWKFHNQVMLLQDICEPENLLGSRNCGLFSSLLRKSRAGISFLHINASSFTWSSETSSRKLVLKAIKFQNV